MQLFINQLLLSAVDEMDMPFLSAYLDSVGTPSFQKGCNFAAGGSTILPASPTSVSPFSFGIQISQFLRFKARVNELLAKGTRMSILFYRLSIYKESFIKIYLDFTKIKLSGLQR